jgi:toluene monooxygenase system protein A
MPGLARSEWYDLTRDMNWTLSYVDQEEAWPSDVSNTYGIPAENWWGWPSGQVPGGRGHGG